MAGTENSGHKWFKGDQMKKMRDMLETSNAHERFRSLLRNTTKDEIFLKAYELANDRAYGRPIQPNVNSSTDSEFADLEAIRDSIEGVKKLLGNFGLGNSVDQIQ